MRDCKHTEPPSVEICSSDDMDLIVCQGYTGTHGTGMLILSCNLEAPSVEFLLKFSDPIHANLLTLNHGS